MEQTQTLNDAGVVPEVITNKRILDIFVMADGSTSTKGLPNSVLNQAMRESAAALKAEADTQPETLFRFRAISFANKAKWHIGPSPVEVENLSWKDLKAAGCTATGGAVKLLADAVAEDKMPEQAHPPVMVLISDGANTDGEEYDRAIERLDSEIWGAKAVRLAIGIGKRYDRKQLEKFTNHPEVGVLEAANAVDLVQYIKYATVTASQAASNGKSSQGKAASNVQLPPLPKPAQNVDPKLAFKEY